MLLAMSSHSWDSPCWVVLTRRKVLTYPIMLLRLGLSAMNASLESTRHPGLSLTSIFTSGPTSFWGDGNHILFITLMLIHCPLGMKVNKENLGSLPRPWDHSTGLDCYSGHRVAVQFSQHLDGTSLLYLYIVYIFSQWNLSFSHNMVLLLRIVIVLKKYILLVTNI